ncbi:MAG TPA: DUF1996 domain-containing protein [Actinomycetota bacterium]|nr:DUF1996 domain-containing protein [Actinomycetota bacterium]
MKRLLLIGFPIVALLGLPAPAAAAPPGQFVVRCPYSHSLMDDPIVFPGQPGASHMHDFFGNQGVNAFSTMASMLAGQTTCRVPSDTAGYWTPAASIKGVAIEPTVMRIYYLGSSAGAVETIPAGLQIVGGNRDATSPAENPHVKWNCGQTKDVKTPDRDAPYDCTPWAVPYKFVDGIVAVIDFPSCWNGIGLRPEDVAYPVAGSCPPGFGHVIPKLSERVHFGVMDPTRGGTLAFKLSSGPWYTMHADFWNTWQQERLDQLVADCLVARTHCGLGNATSKIAWSRQFGTVRYDLAYAAASDGKGGAYAAGFTNFTLPGQVYRHGYDAFLTRYNANGRELWTRQFGTHGRDQAFAVAASGANVYVAGSTDGRFPKQQHHGGLDGFVARFDRRGHMAWVEQFGSPGADEAAAILASEDGAVLGGTTRGRLSGQRPDGPSDAFLVSVNTNGVERWARVFGGDGEDAGLAVAALGNKLYLAGRTQGLGHTVADQDGFVAAFGPGGSPLRSFPLGGAGTDTITSIAARSAGVFFAGSTTGTFLDQAPLGGVDAVIGLVGSSGSVLWHQQFGSAADDDASALDLVGNSLYVAGTTAGALPESTALGESDGFVRKYLVRGTQVWTWQFGTNDFDRVYGLATDSRGAVAVGTTHGAFEGQANAGDRDVFLVRIAFT